MCDDVDYVIIIIIIIFIFIVDSDYDRRHTKNVNDWMSEWRNKNRKTMDDMQ